DGHRHDHAQSKKETSGAARTYVGGNRRLNVNARGDGPSAVISARRAFASSTVGRSPRGTHHIASACPPTTAFASANHRLREAYTSACTVRYVYACSASIDVHTDMLNKTYGSENSRC